MQRRYFALAIIVVILLSAAAMTNPNKQQYVGWAKLEIIQESGGGLMGIIASVAAPTLVDALTKANDYFLFSTYTTTLLDEEIVILGAFNKFIPISKGKVEQQAKK